MRDRLRGGSLALVLLLVLAACSPASPTPVPSPTPTPSLEPTTAPTTAPTSAPTATPEPPLSLPLPDRGDPRQIRVTVDPQLPADGDGQLVISVTNLADSRVTELVLRWDTDLRQTILLAPFRPSEQRIADGGPPLYQEWTKWVNGPGEHGEPAGTTSIGWGPLDPGATLTIPLVAFRRDAGGVSFDLQLLAGESILSLEGGEPADLRVDVP
jgi:hypothetical protein